MIERPNYIDKIKPFIDVKVVKILAGIRRCGKSTILEMLASELKLRGVDSSHIIMKSYASADFGEDYDVTKMYEDIKGKIVDSEKYLDNSFGWVWFKK